jgi:tetratricopeptide (TPR) repeat protein
LHKNSAAFTQLNYLYDKGLINFDKRLQLARFNMYAGNFGKANELLNKADSIPPYVLPEILNLHGLANMLANTPEAITAYKKCVAVQKNDTLFNNFTIARLYAKTGKIDEAWKYLQYAIAGGFNYSYVLQNDSYLESLRKTPKWQTIINGITMKKYESNKLVN